MLQMSGSGLVAPCGMLFNERYKKFHIGNITEERFRDIFYSDRYWEVMNYLASPDFNAQKMCGSLCLQHKVNEFLDRPVATIGDAIEKITHTGAHAADAKVDPAAPASGSPKVVEGEVVKPPPS